MVGIVSDQAGRLCLTPFPVTAAPEKWGREFGMGKSLGRTRRICPHRLFSENIFLGYEQVAMSSLRISVYLIYRSPIHILEQQIWE